jgi:copper oxidase (laccase) domain-containing protein
LITGVPEAVLGSWVGDCAPVAVIGDSNVSIAHAGWRGVRDGVLESVFAAFRSVGDRPRSAIIVPHIRSCCNEFGRDDLATMVERFGSIASSTDSCGRPSLDLRSIIRSELERADVGRVITIDACTRCRNDRYFSHRAGDPERQVMAIRIDAEVGSDDR